MIKFYKSKFNGFNPLITEWDEPVNRRFNGKEIQGRRTKAFGTADFEYAGRLYKPVPWTQPMKYIKGNLETFIKQEFGRTLDFNFCLCGYYGIDGKGIPHHSDTVPTLDDLVVSISFGSPRIFQWQEYKRNIKEHTATSKINTHYIAKKRLTNYLMENGDTFVFDGHSQMKATHAVPDVIGGGERVNLTFRTGI